MHSSPQLFCTQQSIRVGSAALLKPCMPARFECVDGC